MTITKEQIEAARRAAPVHLGPALDSTIAAVGEAIMGAQAEIAVAVKPLEWVEVECGHWWSETPFGGEYVQKCTLTEENEISFVYCCVDYPTVDEAKAAAQADYERRIFSVLITQPTNCEENEKPQAACFLSEGTLRRVSEVSSGAIREMISNVNFGVFTVPVYLEPIHKRAVISLTTSPADEWTKVVTRLTQERDEAREENERLKALLAEFLPPKVEWKERDVDSVIVHHKISLINDARAYLRDGTLPATAAEARVKALEADRDKIASCIYEAAVNLNICRANAVLDGPQILMLLGDISDLARRAARNGGK